MRVQQGVRGSSRWQGLKGPCKGVLFVCVRDRERFSLCIAGFISLFANEMCAALCRFESDCHGYVGTSSDGVSESKSLSKAIYFACTTFPLQALLMQHALA